MFIQPGKDKDEIVAFDKHIGKVPTWSEDKIEGSFEQPQLYTVRLYFAEIEDQPAGRRIFEVSLQDNHVLKDFDIAKAADGPNRCIVKEFRSIPIKDDLKITLTPSADSDAPPLLNGIEILAEDQ